MTMDFQSAMETFAEAWVAANTESNTLSENIPQVNFSKICYLNFTLPFRKLL